MRIETDNGLAWPSAYTPVLACSVVAPAAPLPPASAPPSLWPRPSAAPAPPPAALPGPWCGCRCLPRVSTLDLGTISIELGGGFGGRDGFSFAAKREKSPCAHLIRVADDERQQLRTTGAGSCRFVPEHAKLPSSNETTAPFSFFLK